MTTHRSKSTATLRYLSHAANSDRLITPEELSEAIGVPITSLYAWRRKGTGPRCIKVGHNLRYKPSDIEKWLNLSTSVSTDMTAR